MAGTVMIPAPAAGMDVASSSHLTPSSVNSFRISAVAERLALHVRTPPKNDAIEFFNLCLSLSRGIDYAVANNEVPPRAQELPELLKQVCQCKNDSLLQAAIMVLMISVKNACKNGWFLTKDSEELLTLAEEVASIFSNVRDMNTEASSTHVTISAIMSRFYPRMKMGEILAFLEVKPGYGASVADFFIPKNTKSSRDDKIRLFVAQTDNIETSSCIISPQQVNFLLNGKGVERRTNVFMDTGPQLPTIVTHMLKYGTNLLQALGHFNGNYIILVAYMSMIPNHDHPVLQNYVHSTVAAPGSDSDLVEGPSRISLNCPISFRRIKTPVKGRSCKHLQCFDFDNYVDINSRRPSWRCPHCNQSVCYLDIRVDQNMVEILRDVGEKVADVIISADGGSWEAVAESNDSTDEAHEKTSNRQQDELIQQNVCSSSSPPDIMDLTKEDDEMDVMLICETQDRKPSLANLQVQSSINPTIPSSLNSAGEATQSAPPIEDEFWSGIYLSANESGVSNGGSDAQMVGGVFGSAPTNFMVSPVLTDAAAPALNREMETFRGSALFETSVPRSQISASRNFQLQQSQFENSILSNEYGTVPSMPRHVNRTPIAVQALPAQAPTLVTPQRSRNSFNNFIPQGPLLAPQTSAVPSNGFNTISATTERQQQFSRSLFSSLQASQMTSSSLAQHSTAQNQNYQDHPFISNQAAQQIVGLPAPSQLPSTYRVSSALTTDYQHSRQHPPVNLRLSHGMSQSSTLLRSSTQPTQLLRSQIPQGGTQSGVGQTAVPGSNQRLVAAQRAAQLAGQSPVVPVSGQTTRASSSFPVNPDGLRASVGDMRGNTGGALPSAMRTDGLADLPSEQNWRPTGRMRGSLSGRAYSDALNQFIVQPTQPVQAARPPVNVTSPPPGIPFPLHVLMTNSRNAHGSPTVNLPRAELTGLAGSSGVLPERSSGMQ